MVQLNIRYIDFISVHLVSLTQNLIIRFHILRKKIDNNTMLPITGVENNLICPNDVKILISCGCKLSCNPRYCGCIKNDRKCYEACKNCSGFSCTNYNNEIDEDEECEYDDESDDDNGIDINSDSDVDSDTD